MDKESTDAHRESADVPRKQKGSEGPRRRMALCLRKEGDNHELHQGVELRTAMATEKRRNAQEDPI
jgi:hypothetical protein